MSENYEMQRAEWTIPYPTQCNPELVPGLLKAMTTVKHEMDDFPWHLVSQLINYLEKPEAIFEYLHLSEFYRARSVMLTLSGKVLNQTALHAALSKYQVQVGGIYRYVLIRTARKFLENNNLALLPECDIYSFDPAHASIHFAKNRDAVERLIELAEFEFINILDFISVATGLHEEIAGHRLEFWVKGAERPDVVFVPAQVQAHEFGYDVMPPPDVIKLRTRERMRVQKFSKGRAGELALAGSEQAVTEPVDSKQLADPAGSRQFAVSSEEPVLAKLPQAKVVGDFNVIVLPKGRKIVLTRKYKRRAFMRAVHTWCTKNQTDTFYWQDILEDYNAQFKDSGQKTRKIVTDRIDHDLFRRQKAEFKELFQILDRSAGQLRLKFNLLVSQTGCWGVLWAVGSSLSEYAADVPW